MKILRAVPEVALHHAAGGAGGPRRVLVFSKTAGLPDRDQPAVGSVPQRR